MIGKTVNVVFIWGKDHCYLCPLWGLRSVSFIRARTLSLLWMFARTLRIKFQFPLHFRYVSDQIICRQSGYLLAKFYIILCILVVKRSEYLKESNDSNHKRKSLVFTTSKTTNFIVFVLCYLFMPSSSGSKWLTYVRYSTVDTLFHYFFWSKITGHQTVAQM